VSDEKPGSDSRREEKRRWREANPDKVAAQHQRYQDRLKKRAESAARSARWREEHPEQARETKQRWVQDNPDAVRETNKRYYESHREERLKAAQDYRATEEGRRRHNEQQRERRKQQGPEKAEQRLEQQRQKRSDPKYQAQIYAQNAERRRIERRLKALGLPPRRLHRVPVAHKRQHAEAAEHWFSRKRTKSHIEQIKAEARPNEAQRREGLRLIEISQMNSIARQISRARDQEQLTAEFLESHGPLLRHLVIRTNMRRAAVGRSSRPVEEAIKAVAANTVAKYFAARAPGETHVDPADFYRHVSAQLTAKARQQAPSSDTGPVTQDRGRSTRVRGVGG